MAEIYHKNLPLADCHSVIGDADNDTYIHCEKSADEDIIRFYIAGVERASFGSTGDFTITGSGRFGNIGVGTAADAKTGVSVLKTFTETDLNRGFYADIEGVDSKGQTIDGSKVYIGTHHADDVAYGFHYELKCDSAAGSQYGVYVNANYSPPTPSLSNFYGVYVTAANLSATTKYGVYVKDVKSYFGGDVEITGNLSTTSNVTAVGHFIDSTPATDHKASGTLAAFTANENQAFGDVCYINTDGEMQLGKADAIATAKIVAMVADATIDADASGNYLLFGTARDDTWDWTVGGFVYLSTTGTTGNTLTQTAPSATDQCIVIIGVATHADRLLYSPQLVIVEHTG